MFPFREQQRNILTILTIFSFNSCMLLSSLTFQTTDYSPVHLSPHLPPIPPHTNQSSPPPTNPPPPPHPPNNSPSPSSHHLTPTPHPNHLPHKGWKPCSLSSPVFVYSSHGKIWKRLNVLCYQSRIAANKIYMLFQMVLNYKKVNHIYSCNQQKNNQKPPAEKSCRPY